MNFNNFIYNYFAKTIVLDYGYNIVNTIAYLILAFLTYFFVIKYIKKYYHLNNYFFLAIAFFSSFGAMLRVMEEPYSNFNFFTRSANPLNPGFYFITPGIYYLILAIILFFMYLFHNYKNKEQKLMYSAIILFGINLGIMISRLTFPISLFLIVLAIIIISFILKVIFNLDFKEYLTILGQTTDGIATYTALTFFPYFQEQHVASNFLINHFGTISFPLIKIIITIITIFLVRKIKNKEIYLLFIMLFGFATGVRDIFSIVCHKL